MKKFISVLTSVCIAATALVGTAISSVSAADTMMFAVQGDKTTITEAEIAAGAVKINCGLYITEWVDAATFGLKMAASNSDYITCTAGDYPAIDNFCLDTGDAYMGEVCIFTYSQMNAVWKSGNEAANATVRDLSCPFVEFELTVAQNTPAGTYTVNVLTEPYINAVSGKETKNSITDIDNNEVAFDSVPLTITIGDVAESTTTTEDTTTTEEVTTTTTAEETTTTEEETTATVGDHATMYEIGTVIGAAAGDTVSVPVTVTGDTGTAAVRLELAFDSRLTADAITKTNGTAYRGTSTLNYDADDGHWYFLWYSSNGTDTTATAGAVVFTMNVTIPADAVDGDLYKLEFVESGAQIQNTDQVALDTGFINGYILVGEEVITSSTDETTTTEEETTTTTTEEATTAATEESTTTTTTTAVVGTVLYGDVNVDGVVKINDVVLLNRSLAGTATLTAQGALNADCKKDANNTLDSSDSLMIKQYLAQLITADALGAE